MAISNMIYKIRHNAGMSQEQFAQLFGISRQSVQKWENGASLPELDKIIKIAKYFDISIDALVLESDTRITEELKYNREIKPKYANLHDWEEYSADLLTEYEQSVDEGLDVAQYKDTFAAVAQLPKGEIKKKFGDVLFEAVLQAKPQEGYPYIEPSVLEEIRNLRKPYAFEKNPPDPQAFEKKLHGAWMGRICGCLLGRTIEGVRTNELHPFLKETGNWPMHRYIHRADLTDEICEKYNYRFASRDYADEVDGMPPDDDTNYTVLAQVILEKYGREFTAYDVSRAWLDYQHKDAYCTAERVAFCNFVKGFEPPESAMYKNPYREWIGAQIRADYFGYINPGDPEAAADMAFRDASISHIKNGIYGEMFVAAMLACAAVTDNVEDIIRGGLAEIPQTSRLYEAVTGVLTDYRGGMSQKDCFDAIHQRFDEYTGHGWTHTISNAMIVTAALLYGRGDYGRSICMAVETGFDTDCNGATVGSVIGMRNGIDGIDAVWTAPVKDTLHTSVFGVGTVKISDCVKRTVKHAKLQPPGEG